MQVVRFSNDIEAVFQAAFKAGKLPWSSVYELIVYLVESDERLYLADPPGLEDFIELLTAQDAMPRAIAVALHQHPLFGRELFLAIEAKAFNFRSTAKIMRQIVKDASWEAPVQAAPSPPLMAQRLKTFELISSQKGTLKPKKAELQITNTEHKEIILKMDGGVAALKKDSEVIDAEYTTTEAAALSEGDAPADLEYRLPPRSPGQTIQSALVREAAKVLADHE